MHSRDERVLDAAREVDDAMPHEHEPGCEFGAQVVTRPSAARSQPRPAEDRDRSGLICAGQPGEMGPVDDGLGVASERPL